MRCTECNKNFTTNRKDAKFCSGKCRTSNYRRLKKEASVFNTEQKITLGKIQEKQKSKVLILDEKIRLMEQKIIPLKQGFSQLKEQEKIALIELKTIRAAVKESEQEMESLHTILALNDEKFYAIYCSDAEVRADDLGFLLNGIINVSLIGFNSEERNKEINRMRNKITNELFEWEEVLKEDKFFMKELYQKLIVIRKKLKKQHTEILSYIEKIKELKKQQLIPVKDMGIKKPIQQINPIGNNGVKNSVGGAELLNMTFNTFTLDGELGRFLGELDRNRTAFALTGDSGAGKSYFSFELAKVFIDASFKAKYFALEEGLGKLTQNKVRFYGLGNDITITGKGTLRDVRRDAKLFDLIVIDSFQKLNVKAEEFERLRQDFPKTIFIIIFQKTASGSMRGGSSIKFNSSATIDVQIRDEERMAVMEKGRYGTIGWVYSIDERRVVNEK